SSDLAAVEVISYKVYAEEELDKIEEVVKKNDLAYKWVPKGEQHAVGRALRVQDVSGLSLEFYAEMDKVESLLQRYDLQKGSRVQRIDHLNCLVPDVQKAYDFYMKNSVSVHLSIQKMTKENYGQFGHIKKETYMTKRS